MRLFSAEKKLLGAFWVTGRDFNDIREHNEKNKGQKEAGGEFPEL